MAEPLNSIYFPAAVMLGALHALEPGHAKALTASYLIGIHGTQRDSLILGLSVAATHSVVVILIASIGLWAGNAAFTGQATLWLERASGILAVLIGSWMLWRRLWIPKVAHSHQHDHSHGDHDHHHYRDHHDHGHGHHHHLDDIAHAKAHAEQLPDYVKRGDRPSIAQIISFGAAGGMIPCPASITVMLLAISTGRAAMGFVTVLGFSLGLAISLVGVGFLVVTGLSKLSENGRLSWVTRHAPVASACLVIASGIFALFVASEIRR